MAIFLLLLRPGVVVEGVGEVGDGGGGVVGVEVAGLGDVVGVVGRVEAVAEVRGMWGLVVEDVGVGVGVGVGVLDALIRVVVGPAVVGFDVALDAPVSPPSCESVHSTGFCPLFMTMLKSLLMNVGGVALEVLRSDTSKWHTQAFPSSRGTRAEPVAETDWL